MATAGRLTIRYTEAPQKISKPYTLCSFNTASYGTSPWFRTVHHRKIMYWLVVEPPLWEIWVRAIFHAANNVTSQPVPGSRSLDPCIEALAWLWCQCFPWKTHRIWDVENRKPIGSMVLLYMVCHGSHQYTPVMLALINQHHGSVMGYGFPFGKSSRNGGCFSLRVENRTSVLHVFMSFMGLTGWGGEGCGGVITFICTSSHIWYYVIVCGGVGWGGVITFIGTSSHIWCYATVCRLVLPHIYDATLYCMSSCTSSHTWCYATVCRLALPHRYDATLLYVVLHFLTYMMLRYCMSSCTSSQIWCYATVCRLALPHIYDATLLYVVLHFLTDMMLRYCMSSCTSSQIWCYATVCRLALPHRYDATLLHVVLHFLTYMMLR